MSVPCVTNAESLNRIVDNAKDIVAETEFDLSAVAVSQTMDLQPQADVEAKFEENLYECHHLTGGAKHPGKITETPGLANIKSPRPTHRPRLPKNLIEVGQVSEIQLERIIYAGQAHSRFLPCDRGASRDFHRRRDGCW